MLIRLTDEFDKFRRKVTSQYLGPDIRIRFKNDAYFHFIDRELDDAKLQQIKVTEFTMKKGEVLEIPDETAYSDKFQQLFKFGLMEEILRGKPEVGKIDELLPN